MEASGGKRGHKGFIGIIFIVIISLVISGCWDRRELEERRLVLAIGVDRAEQENDISRIDTFAQPHGNKRYRLSLQILNIMPSQSTAFAPQGEIGTYVISNTGESLFEIIRDMLGQVNQSLWFEHVQTIIISEEAIKEGNLQFVIDFFRRDREIRRLTKIFITSGEARSLLEYQPPNKEPSGMFIANSLRLYRKNAHIPGWNSDVGDVAESIDHKERIVIARIELMDQILKLGGMAFFHKGKFIGYVDEYATKGGAFLNGTEKSAIITIECPNHPGKIVVFELFRHETTLTPHVEGDLIYYTLDITMRGNLGESQCGKEHHVIDSKIHKVEDLVAKEIKENILYTLKTYQKLKVDGSIFGEKLKVHEPLVWEKIKDHWDEEVFPNISMNVSVNVVIENIGEHQ